MLESSPHFLLICPTVVSNNNYSHFLTNVTMATAFSRISFQNDNILIIWVGIIFCWFPEALMLCNNLSVASLKN